MLTSLVCHHRQPWPPVRYCVSLSLEPGLHPASQQVAAEEPHIVVRLYLNTVSAHPLRKVVDRIDRKPRERCHVLATARCLLRVGT
jgi:hypothetical protein